MNSLNHYSYGSIVESMFRHRAGIQPLEKGFRTARIAPELNDRIGSLSAIYDSPAGKYQSSWRLLKTMFRVEMHFEVPFGAEGGDMSAVCA